MKKLFILEIRQFSIDPLEKGVKIRLLLRFPRIELARWVYKDNKIV